MKLNYNKQYNKEDFKNMGQNCCSERDLNESKQQKQQLFIQHKLNKKKKAFAVGTNRDLSNIDASKPQSDYDQPILIERLEKKKELKTS